MASVIMLGIILSAALGVLPIAISAPLGALMMILTGCMGWRDATNALSAQVILIAVASLALSVALVKTGGAAYLAQLFVALTGGASPAVILSGLMLLMGILTNIVSNNATAVIGTPMAYKTNLRLMNAGEYTFNDFLRTGIPLVLIMWLALSWLPPVIYGLPFF